MEELVGVLPVTVVGDDQDVLPAIQKDACDSTTVCDQSKQREDAGGVKKRAQGAARAQVSMCHRTLGSK